NVKQPHFLGSVADPGNTVQIFGNGVRIGQGIADSSGNWMIQATSPLADNTYVITARQVDSTGRAGAFSGAMTPNLVIDTVAAAPPAPGLLPADDTGASNTDHHPPNWT